VNLSQKSEAHQRFFTANYEWRLFTNVGHNAAQEARKAFAQAILDLCKRQ
jgi:pimeloyl-ACP methyl ester carboxylesterase